MSKSCLSNNSKTTEANLTKLLKQLEHNKKVCRAQELGSYAQGQGHNQVRGQIVPKIVLLINFCSKFDEASQKDESIMRRCVVLKIEVPTPKVRCHTRVSAITQKLLK